MRSSRWASRTKNTARALQQLRNWTRQDARWKQEGGRAEARTILQPQLVVGFILNLHRPHRSLATSESCCQARSFVVISRVGVGAECRIARACR